MLYRRLDLSSVPEYCIDHCVTVLASTTEIADFVVEFSCPVYPSQSPSFALALSMALKNTRYLRTLTLPSFRASVFRDTSFHLHSLILLHMTASASDEHALFSSWLPTQTELKSFSLASLCPASNANLATILPETSFCLRRLNNFSGPPLLAAHIAPGRPLTHVSLYVDSTLFDGLRPAAVMSALARSTAPITYLSIFPTVVSAIDSRTLTKLFLAAGTELGLALKELRIGWQFDAEVRFLSFFVWFLCARQDG